MSRSGDGALVGPPPDDASSLRLLQRASSASARCSPVPPPYTSSRSVSSAFLVGAIDQCPVTRSTPVFRHHQVVSCSRETTKKQEMRMTQRESAAAPFSPEVVKEKERERALA
ncbi:hypothetical protein GOP47_0010929 [Adiantum capillus-veneris]|uniref:Uncharacterized protein n=1 Tax=Adiantum capillus-veneris TaxID=13818 RepID=A0A9D4UVW9_ADICA|nr:hypothetical protein GOP47_0010929 [Adiantum capillus-veneris]